MDNDEDSNYRKSLLPHVFGLLVIFGRFGGDFGRKNDDFGENCLFGKFWPFFENFTFLVDLEGGQWPNSKIKRIFFLLKNTSI